MHIQATHHMPSVHAQYYTNPVQNQRAHTIAKNHRTASFQATDTQLPEQVQSPLSSSLGQLVQQINSPTAPSLTQQAPQGQTGSLSSSVDKPETDNPWNTNRGDIMLFGDPVENRIVPMKLSTFERLPDIDIDAQRVYSADHITDDKAYVMNRGSNYMTVLERNASGEFKETGDIDLPFWPRTGAKNTQLGLELVTGIDKPMFGLIDYTKDELVAAGGRNIVTQGSINNYDGENATGHGIWVSGNQFILPDRENSTLDLYQAQPKNGSWEVLKQDSMTLPSSTHTTHGGPDEGIFYAALEGDPQTNTPSGLAKLALNGDTIELQGIANMPLTGLDDQGTHHPAFHPNGKDIYVGDNSGYVHIVDKDSMQITQTTPAGKGAGHVAFVPERNMAIVTNHHDTFISVIDMTNHSLMKNVEVAEDAPEFDEALQAHTARIDPDKNYYYNFASDSGTFFRVNLDTLKKDGEIYTGGTPKQASQPGELTLGYTGEVGQQSTA